MMKLTLIDIRTGDTALNVSNSEVEKVEGDKLSAKVVKCVRIGIVATNQARKDWGLMGAVCARLTEELKGNVSFWWHVDREIHYWSLPAIAADFQLGEYVEITFPPVDDKWLAEQYRRCAVTLHPGSEGFGFPIFESLACGTPAVHGDYAGGASIMSTCGLSDLLVQPRNYRVEGQFNCIRPVYAPEDWTAKVMEVLARLNGAHDYASHVSHLSWLKLGHTWKKWLREGIGHDEQ